MPKPPKIQRWIDLIAALLRGSAYTFAQLAHFVPAYDGENEDTVKRMFERDKVELREMGIPILTVGAEGDEEMRYRIKPEDFYLPYLDLVAERDGKAKATRVSKYGYRALKELAFEPDELHAIVLAGARVRMLGDPALVADAERALRKLAFDLPLDGARADDDAARVLPTRRQSDPAILETLGWAVVHRKRATFEYTSLTHADTRKRTLEPYGLFFVDAHWYLAAHDPKSGEVRNFRVSRIATCTVNRAKELSPDFEVRPGFDLREHARSRQAWELGDGDAIQAIVEFTPRTGAVTAAMKLGAAVKGHEHRRAFQVRRVDSFARWLLSFGGDAIPMEPASVREELRRIARETLALYA